MKLASGTECMIKVDERQFSTPLVNLESSGYVSYHQQFLHDGRKSTNFRILSTTPSGTKKDRLPVKLAETLLISLTGGYTTLRQGDFASLLEFRVAHQIANKAYVARILNDIIGLNTSIHIGPGTYAQPKYRGPCDECRRRRDDTAHFPNAPLADFKKWSEGYDLSVLSDTSNLRQMD